MIVGIPELLRQATEVKPDELRPLVLLQERADGSELLANYGGTHIRIVRRHPSRGCKTRRDAEIGPSTSEKVLAAQHQADKTNPSKETTRGHTSQLDDHNVPEHNIHKVTRGNFHHVQKSLAPRPESEERT